MTSCFIDINVLLRIAEVESPMHSAALNAIFVLKSQDVRLCVVSQNLVEFWVAATRPISSNGLGLTADEAIREIQKVIRVDASITRRHLSSRTVRATLTAHGS